MKYKIVIILLLFFGISAYAQQPLPGKRIDYYSSWTERGAKVVPLNELHLSALAVSRFGNYKNTEINSQLLLIPFIPNIGLKHQWKGKTTILSSQHTFYYPTPGLKWAKNNNFDYQIPKTSSIPQIFTFRNELIVSHILNSDKACTSKIPDLILTGRLGFDFSLKSGKSDFPIIDTHFLYQRTASYYDKIVYFIGAELAGNIYHNFNFSITADLYNINFTSNFALESQGRIHWHINGKFALSGGYNLYYLNVDNTDNQFFITPAIDFTFKIGHKERLQRGLFKP